MEGFSTPAETGASIDGAEVVIVYRSAKRRQSKIFTRGNTGKKKVGDGVKVGIDKMERLIKEADKGQ
jgi:hypothetical protein